MMQPAVDKSLVPEADAVEATASPETAVPATPEASNYLEYTVQSGQTLGEIAEGYNVDAALIARVNQLPSLNATLEIGQKLRIPVVEGLVNPPVGLVARDASADADAAERTVAIARDSSPSRKVTSKAPRVSEKERLALGETHPATASDPQAKKPSAASSRSDLSDLSALPDLNSEPSVELFPDVRDDASTTSVAILDSSAIAPSVFAPTAEEREFAFAASDEFEFQSYQVQSGETLVEVAEQHDTTVEDIARANNLDDPDTIAAGESLQIPRRQARRSTAPDLATVAAVPGKKQRFDLTASGTTDPADVAIAEDNVPVVLAPEAELDADALELPSPLVRDDADSDIADAPQLEVFRFSDSRNALPDSASSLRADIDRLHDRAGSNRLQPQDDDSQSQADRDVETLAHVDSSDRTLGNLSAREPENPQFDRARIAALREREASGELAATDLDETENEGQDVAVAPLGSQNYAPIMPPRTVSPDLPALSAPGAYLPKPENRLPDTPSQEFAGYTWPAQGVLTSGYGWRWGRMHNGIDIAGPVGTPIVAAAPGTVTYSRWNSGGYGNLVEITHPDGSLTLYAHNHRNLVSEGQQVAQGQQIAEMGSTGFSTGPHLHFEIHPPGQGAINPMALLP